MNKILALMCVGLSAGVALAADPPEAQITNGQITVRLYLPDAGNGFYQGTRFDWSGVIPSLEYAGHDYYGPWFDRRDPPVRDFIYDGDEIVAGAASSVTGPANDFGPIGYEDAKIGETFVKIGVGALRKPSEERHSNYTPYEIADRGEWKVGRSASSIEFIHELTDESSGYGYVYRKTLRLTAGKPEMVMEHSLRNTGKKAIDTTVYNHNFLVLDGQPPGPGFVITVPYQIESERAPNAELAEIRGNQIVYLKTLTGEDVVTTPVGGHSSDVSAHHIRIENRRIGAGMTIAGNRPLLRMALWSIRSNISMEPFIKIDVEPGGEFTWTNTYNYYTLP